MLPILLVKLECFLGLEVTFLNVPAFGVLLDHVQSCRGIVVRILNAIHREQVKIYGDEQTRVLLFILELCRLKGILISVEVFFNVEYCQSRCMRAAQDHFTSMLAYIFDTPLVIFKRDSTRNYN